MVLFACLVVATAINEDNIAEEETNPEADIKVEKSEDVKMEKSEADVKMEKSGTYAMGEPSTPVRGSKESSKRPPFTPTTPQMKKRKSANALGQINYNYGPGLVVYGGGLTKERWQSIKNKVKAIVLFNEVAGGDAVSAAEEGLKRSRVEERASPLPPPKDYFTEGADKMSIDVKLTEDDSTEGADLKCR